MTTSPPPKFNQITTGPSNPNNPTPGTCMSIGLETHIHPRFTHECQSCAGWTRGMSHTRAHCHYPGECCQPDIVGSTEKIPPADWAGDKPAGHFSFSNVWCGKAWTPVPILSLVLYVNREQSRQWRAREPCSCTISASAHALASLNRQVTQEFKERNTFLLQVAFGHGHRNRKQPRSKKRHPPRPAHGVPVLM